MFLWHPADGPTPQRGSPGGVHRSSPYTRREFVKSCYGRNPRNEMSAHPQFAGWKNLLLDETAPRFGARTRVYWQNAAIGHLFWRLHATYISHVRPRVRTNPYYFVSLNHSTLGEPWTLTGVRSAFAGALRRIGLEPNSALGLCPHAMRHRLGHWLTMKRVPAPVIQIFLHHLNIASQAIYSRLRPADVADALARGYEKHLHGAADFNTDDLGIHWRSDPLKLFEGPSERLLTRLSSGASKAGSGV